MTAFEVVSTILNGTIALAAVAATGVAALGLHTWRKQLRGQSEFTTAARLLRSAYRVKGAFQAIRSMVSVSAPDELLPKLQHSLAEYSESLADMEVLSPGLVRQAAGKLEECVRKYGKAVRRRKRIDSGKHNVTDDQYERLDLILWSEPENDALGEKIEAAMQAFERSLRPIVGGSRKSKQKLAARER